jgi:hypothetical protein
MKYVLFTFIGLATLCQANNVLLNPSFEDSDMSPWIRTAISGIRPWSLGAATPQDGDWFVFSVGEASIEQSFDSILGSEITEFGFWIDRPTTSTVLVELLISGGEPSGQTDISSETGPGWAHYDVLPLVNPSENITGIRITKLNTGTTRLDNFSLKVVPEPSTGIIIFIGALFLLHHCRTGFPHGS